MRPGSLTRNTFSNAVLFLLQGLTAVITFPVVLNAAGQRRYGLYAFIAGFMLLAQIAISSLRVIVSKYVAELNATQNSKRLSDVVSLMQFLAIVLNIVAGISILVVVFAGRQVFNVKPEDQEVFVVLGILLALSATLNGALEVPRGVLAGLERFTLRNLLELGAIAGMVLGAALAAHTELGIVGYVAATEVGRLIAGIGCFVASRHLLPELSFVPVPKFRGLSDVLKLNLMQMVNQAADILFYTTDRFILQAVRGAQAVGAYAVIEKPNTLAQYLVALPLSALVPAAARAGASKQTEFLTQLVFMGSRIYIFGVLPPLIAITALMPQLFEHWLGAEFVHLADLARLFVLTSVVAAPFKIYSHVMVAEGRIREIATAKIGFAIVNVPTSYFLARRLGIVGVLIPTILFWVLVYPAVWLRVMARQSFETQRFLRSVASPMGAALTAGALLVTVPAIVTINGLIPTVALLCIGTAAIYCISYLVLKGNERSYLLGLVKR